MDNQEPKISPKRKKLLFILTAVFLLVGILYLVYWLLWGHFKESTDDAYVTGNLVQLMPQISGTVTAIYADDTQLVTAGQPLVKLDPADMLVALQQARANLAETVRRVHQYYENVLEIQATLSQRKADLIKAQLDYQRRIGLINDRAISPEELIHYKTTLETSQSQYNLAVHQHSSAMALVNNVTLYQHPQVLRAEANFRTAYLNWVRTTIYAPVTGYVAKRSVQVGQQASPANPLLAIVPLNDLWVDANFKENQLARIRIGQKCTIAADTNGETYHGKVIGLTPGTGSFFAILPPQNATGNWIKIVQRLPVRVSLDPQELIKHPLQIGLSTTVTAHTRGVRGAILSTKPSYRPIYTTSIYEDELAHANQEINAILQANSPNIQLTHHPIKGRHYG